MVRKKKSNDIAPTHEEELSAIMSEDPDQVPRDEILCDPLILDSFESTHSLGYLRSITDDRRFQQERQEQISRLVAIAREKTEGRVRECLLLLLSGCDSFTEIGSILDISRDSVRRAVLEGAEVLKAHIRAKLPVFQSSDHAMTQLKTTLLPLDTEEEHRALQSFINNHRVQHIALGKGNFREVLVVYQ